MDTPDRTKTEQKNGVEIKDCPHCAGLGECLRVKTGNVEHSCKYCVQKSGYKLTDDLFPHVPCQYCEGKGFYTVDLKIQKPPFKKPFNRPGGQQSSQRR